jgi:hypothetical protein
MRRLNKSRNAHRRLVATSEISSIGNGIGEGFWNRCIRL